MSDSKTLYDKALSNFNSANILLAHMGDDEEQLNIIAYHLQQTLELLIKDILESNGIEYPKTHDVEQLIAIANENNVDLKLNEYLKDHSEMFSQWESKSRYILGYLVEKKKIEQAVDALTEYIKGLN